MVLVMGAVYLAQCMSSPRNYSTIPWGSSMCRLCVVFKYMRAEEVDSEIPIYFTSNNNSVVQFCC